MVMYTKGENMYKDKLIYNIKSLFMDERKIKRRTIELRRLILFWLRDNVSKVPPECVFPRWILIIWATLFPIEFMIFRFNKKFGYDFNSHSINIHGIKYSLALFETMRFAPVGRKFSIVERKDGYNGEILLSLRIEE